MAKVDVVLGLQWGDEGKGKIVDVLASQYKAVARFQGGPNAGHSLKFGEESFVLHSVPSGIFRKGTLNIVGNGVVVDPVILLEEISEIEKRGVDVKSALLLSKRAHLILPTHRILDAASEFSLGSGKKIGSTLKGIGPAYMDKAGRYGLRLGDIISADFVQKYETLKARHLAMLAQYKGFEFDVSDYEQRWLAAVQTLASFNFADTEIEVNDLLDSGVDILAEGAQGSMLDIDFGSYPFVTSSSTMVAGVCTGLGVAASRIGRVYGIFKAYCTRVGSGPFPTELFDSTGETLRQVGREFGATTGRARRCGWLDLPALKYAVRMNGVTDLIMMKPDVLDGFDSIKVAVEYEIDGERTSYSPYDVYAKVNPVYKEFPGWKTPLSGIRSYDDFPAEFRSYMHFIEDNLGVKIGVVSVGPGRDETVNL